MNRNRAQEIAESPVMATVTYKGKPIYIQQVESDDSARVYPLDNPEAEQSAPLDQLLEG